MVYNKGIKIMDEPLQRLTFEDILFEIRQAEKEKREADLSNKLLPEFSLASRTINTTLNLENSTVQGAIYLNNCIINGDIKLNNSLIYTTIYINESEINNFIAKNIRIREVINFLASKIKGNIDMEKSQIKGFISFNRAEVGSDIILNEVIAKDIMTKSGNMKGDLYVRNTKVSGNIFLKDSLFDGLGSFESSSIGKDLDFSGSKFKEVVNLSGLTISGQVIAKTLECKNLIAHI